MGAGATSQVNGAKTAPGAIVLARHGRPDTDKSNWINSRGYYDWWQDYERAGLHPDTRPPENLLTIARESDVILSSTRPRAYETALAVAQGKPVQQYEVFVEAALPPPPLPLVSMRPPTWDIWSRTLWWLGMSRGEESRSAAEMRAFEAVKVLEQQAQDGTNVLLCAHGWFNRMMRPVLQAHNWCCVYDGRDDYWSFRTYEKRDPLGRKKCEA